MSSENAQYPGNGLPPMPGVTLPAEGEEKAGLEIIEAPGPEGEIIAIGDLIPEEGLPIPEFRGAEAEEGETQTVEDNEGELDTSCKDIPEKIPEPETAETIEPETVPEEELAPAEEDIEVEFVPEEEIAEPETEEDIEVDILPEEEIAEPETEEDIRVEIVPEEEITEAPAPITEEKKGLRRFFAKRKIRSEERKARRAQRRQK